MKPGKSQRASAASAAPAPATKAAVDFVLSKRLTLEALAGALGRLGER